uniref:Protein amnionless n=1 Tax=Bursaphelenchus xylophilus TaxID=6326 RepID=A0A1I7RXA8_BURXY
MGWRITCAEDRGVTAVLRPDAHSIFHWKSFFQSLTKQGFEDFLYTREGQQVFRLTNPLYAKNFTMASRNTAPYVFQCPDPEAFVIKRDDPPKEGQLQSTLNEIVFSEICSYVKCIDPTGYCDTPIRPVGHCCSICGTMATFSQVDFDYDAAQQALRDSEVERDNKTGFSLIRIQFAGSALYQLHLLWLAKYTPTSKFLEFVIVAFIVCSVGAVMFRYELHKNPALRSWINRQNSRFPEHLVRFRGEENVVLTLAGHEEVAGSEQSETFVNPVFEFDDSKGLTVDSAELQVPSSAKKLNIVETLKNEI